MMKNIIEYLRSSKDKYPDKIAFVDEEKSISFRQLDEEAQKMATLIIDKCGSIKNNPIAVYIDKSVDSIISFFGIVYSGNFYVPLDIKSPFVRVKNILETLNPIAVISKDKKLENFGGWIDIDFELHYSYEVVDLTKKTSMTLDIDPLYVLFTSGSTGKPKGVIISHKSVIDYTEWLSKTFNFNEKTIFGNQAPFYFDNSILDIYSTLKHGATMYIIPEKLFPFSKLLLEYLKENKINTLFWVPSALISVANSGVLENTKLDMLENVLFCGEVMPNKQLNIWRNYYPNILYANLYGPTEITDVCTYYIVNRKFDDNESLPIGFPCENSEIIVLNENNQPISNDEHGELCVRGTCLSYGYYNDNEKTDASFVQNPLNHSYYEKIYRTGDIVKYNEFGELIYICRKDYQIKHQGYRIELGEIEIAVSSIDGVHQNCVIYDDSSSKIILFCTTNGYIDSKSIYKCMQTKLPKYMLPTKINILPEMPLNVNGKIDRLKLKENHI